MPVDIDVLNAEDPRYGIEDSYDSLLWIDLKVLLSFSFLSPSFFFDLPFSSARPSCGPLYRHFKEAR